MSRSHLSLDQVNRMRIAGEVYTRRSVLGGGAKVAGGLFAAGPVAAFISACGGDDGGNGTGGGTIREIGLSLTEDPRILGPFEDETGIRVEGRSEGLGDQISFWQQNHQQYDINQVNFNQIGAIQDTLRTIPVDDIPAWNNDISPLFREPGVPGYNEQSGWPLAGIYTEEAIANESSDEMWGVPTWYGFDAFGYIDGETGGDLESYGAIFDPENEGRATLLDEPITSVMKVATFLSATGQASFDGPINNLTADDLEICFDFLAEQKSRGQFRLFWSDFGQLVDLLVAGEVFVGDFWASACAAAVQQGANAVFVNDPTEGSNGWLQGATVSKDTQSYDQVTEFISWSLDSGVLGEVLGLQGYYTPRPDVVQPRLEDSMETNDQYNDWEYWWQGAVPEERPALEDRLPKIADWQAYPDEFEEYSRRWTQFVAA